MHTLRRPDMPTGYADGRSNAGRREAGAAPTSTTSATPMPSPPPDNQSTGGSHALTNGWPTERATGWPDALAYREGDRMAHREGDRMAHRSAIREAACDKKCHIPATAHGRLKQRFDTSIQAYSSR